MRYSLSKTRLILFLSAFAAVFFLLSCTLVPFEQAPHDNPNDPDNEDYQGPDLPAALLSGLPGASTYADYINITVGGSGIVAYKYSLDGEAYSEERDISVSISRTNLEVGGHTISVLGKNSGNLWQWESRVTKHSWEIKELTDTTPPSIININPFAKDYHDGAASLNIQWNTPEEFVLLLRKNSPIAEDIPINQTEYSAGQTLSGCQVLYAGDLASISDSAFSTDGPYYYRAFAYDEYFNYAQGGTERFITVFKDAVYVHFNGNDANQGTSGAPLRSIQAGINRAAQLETISKVFVAGTADFEIPEKGYSTGNPDIPAANMQRGISIYGGYDPGNWAESSRAPATHVTRLFTAAGLISANACIILADALDSPVIINGFRIESPDTSNEFLTMGVLIQSCTGKVTVSDCDILGGASSSTTGGLTYGIRVLDSSDVEISGNRRIWGGNSSGTGGTFGLIWTNSSGLISGNNTGYDCISSYGATNSAASGILVESSPNNLIIENNNIRGVRLGGSAPYSQGVRIQASNAVIRNCRIEAYLNGSGTSYGLLLSSNTTTEVTVYNCHILGSSTEGNSAGVSASQSNFSLYNNNIGAGPSITTTWANGIRLSSFDTYNSAVGNNNIYCVDVGSGTNYGIYESGPGALDFFGGNNFFNCSTSAYYNYDITGNLDDSTVASMGMIAENIFDSLVFDSDGRVTDGGSEFMYSGIDGAEQGWGFSGDKEGTARTGNGLTDWSIGPYEYD